jgi:glycosyltransferase involved in cell wall biosynthesis
MANAWLDRAHEVWLVSTYLGAGAPAYPLRPGVSVVLLSEAIPDHGTTLWRVTLKKICALRQLLLTIGPDVVISFLTNVNVLAILARASSGIPLIISERTDPLHDGVLPRALRMARTICYRFADALVVQSSTAAERFGALVPGVSRMTVIHNPLPAELAASPKRAHQQGQGGCVVAMGRLSREKGFPKLIEAFANALRDESGWELRIWGEGPLREDLQRQVQRLQLSDRVQLCGLTDQPWTALAAGQIFVLSSEYEGFPNAMLEAMALGLSCIAFDCPSGPRELADGGRAALLVPHGDVAALTAALGELACDPELRRTLGAHAATFVRSQFAQPSVMADWDALIEEVTAGRRPQGERARTSAPGR